MDYNNLIKQLRETPSRSKRELLDKAAQAIEQLEQKLNALNSVTVQEWIPVKERLPEEDKNIKKHIEGKSFGFLTVLTYNGVVKQTNRFFCNVPQFGLPQTNGWEWASKDVTHWMPMPEPPEERIDETILQQDELLKRRDALKGMKINDEGITGK